MATVPAVESIRLKSGPAASSTSSSSRSGEGEAGGSSGEEDSAAEPPSCRSGPTLVPSGPETERGEPRPHSYLSPKCEVRRTADRGGHTVVARLAIRKGELILIWSGTLINGTELAVLPASVRRCSLQVEEDHYLVSLSDSEPPDYVNHSCDPNAGLSGQLALVALRDVRPGEEITYDYAMSDGSPYDEFRCGCGAPGCRGYVSGEDWRRPELWVRYQGYFSPYLERRIARLRRKLAAKTLTFAPATPIRGGAGRGRRKAG